MRDDSQPNEFQGLVSGSLSRILEFDISHSNFAIKQLSSISSALNQNNDSKLSWITNFLNFKKDGSINSQSFHRDFSKSFIGRKINQESFNNSLNMLVQLNLNNYSKEIYKSNDDINEIN